MSILPRFTGRAPVPPPDDERPDNDPLLRLELNVRAAQSLIDTALLDYSVARQRSKYRDNGMVLADALLDLDKRLDEGLIRAGLVPSRAVKS